MAYFIPAPTAFSVIPDYQSNPFVSGFEMTVTSTTQFTIASGCCRALTSDFVISYPSYSPSLPPNITVNTASVGVNGCYPVSIASLALTNHTVFPVYVIAKSSGTTNGSLNTSVGTSVVVATGNNFLPPGYDTYRRIGYIYISFSTGLILPWIQGGNSNIRFYSSATNLIIGSGLASLTLARLDLTANNGYVPPHKNVQAEFITRFQGITASDSFTLSDTGVTGTSNALWATPSVTGQLGSTFNTLCGTDPTTGNSSIWYLVSASGCTLQVGLSGFEDDLGNTLV